MIAQGDIWLMEPPNDRKRPVLVITRNEAIGVLSNVVVAPLTGTIRTIPTCVGVGPEEGIDRDSVATFDNIASIPKSLLTSRLGTLGPSGPQRICAALEALADC